MVELLNHHFEGVTPEMLTAQASSDYDPATNTIHYEGSRGGGPLPLRVIHWTQQDDILSISYEHYDYTTRIPDSSFVLTIRLMGDGSFRYLSNQHDTALSTQLIHRSAQELTDQEAERYMRYPEMWPVLAQNWADPEEIEPYRFGTFYGLNASGAADEKYHPEQYGDGETLLYAIPQNIFEGFSQQYFDVSSAHLRKSTFYDAEQKVYTGFRWRHPKQRYPHPQHLDQWQSDQNHLFLPGQCRTGSAYRSSNRYLH